jgi:hypothetical protein
VLFLGVVAWWIAIPASHVARRAWRKRADLSEYSEGIDDILAAARERGDLQRASSISGERGTIPARSTF